MQAIVFDEPGDESESFFVTSSRSSCRPRLIDSFINI